MNSILSGTYAGFIATGPMTMWMLEWERSLPKSLRSPLPPATLSYQTVKRVAGKAAPKKKRKAGTDSPENGAPGMITPKEGAAQSSLTMAAHFGYGAAAGAAYGLLAGSASRKSNPVGRAILQGTAYGLAVWGLNYLGFTPALGYRAAAPKMPRTRNLMMVTAHVIWGVALARTHAVLVEAGKTALEGERKALRAE